MKWKIELTACVEGVDRKYRTVVEADTFPEARRLAMFFAPHRNFRLAPVCQGMEFDADELANEEGARAHFNEHGFAKAFETDTVEVTEVAECPSCAAMYVKQRGICEACGTLTKVLA